MPLLALALMCAVSQGAVAAGWTRADPAHWIEGSLDLTGWNEEIHLIAKSETTTGGPVVAHDLVGVHLARVGATAIEYSSLAVVDARTGEFVARAWPIRVGRPEIYLGPRAGCDVLDLVNTNQPALEGFRFHATPAGEFWIEDIRGDVYGGMRHRIMMLDAGCLWTATVFTDLNRLEADRDGVFDTTTCVVSFELDEDGTPLVTETSARNSTPCGGALATWQRRVRRYRITAGGATLVESTTRDGYGGLTLPFNDRMATDSLPRERWEKSWRPGVRAGVIRKGAKVAVVELLLDGAAAPVHRVVAAETGVEGFAFRWDLQKTCWMETDPCRQVEGGCPDDPR